MSEQVKGHAEEVAGRLGGDEDLQAEGKAQRRAGEIDERIDQAKDKTEELLGRARTQAEDLLDKARAQAEDLLNKAKEQAGSLTERAKDALHRT